MDMINSTGESARFESLKAAGILLLVSIIWGSAFVAQRVAAQQAGIFFFNGLRFLLGALILLPFNRRRCPLRSQGGQPLPPTRQRFSGIMLAGGLLFLGAAFQQWGLRFTTAGNAGFITGLYVVLIPIFLALGWRRWPRPFVWLAALLAAAGLYFLSTGGRLALNAGDALELVGAVMWAFHVILIGSLVREVPVVSLAIGQYVVCGALNLVAGVVFEAQPAVFTGLIEAWWAVLYTGLLSVGLGYTLQAAAQRVAAPADAAIILSSEAVFAAAFGWLLLGEALTPLQILGCTLMLVSMLLAQFPTVALR